MSVSLSRALCALKIKFKPAFLRSFTTKAASPGTRLFEYARGRFVLGEKEQAHNHRVRVNMQELLRTAAKSVGAMRCIDVEECPDGLYSKALILTMDDETQVVAKIPYPNVGVPYYTTASEVATMDFARNVLQTPAPQIYAWNASIDPKKNPVGAEFIVMEKMAGVPLSDVWCDLKPDQKVKVCVQIIGFMKRWTNVHFPAIGSLYYAETISKSSKNSLYFDGNDSVRNSRFAVGPSSNRDWSDEGRRDIQCDKGPWMSVLDYRKAIYNREMLAVKNIRHIPKQLAMLYGPPPLYEPTVAKKLQALRWYTQIVELLLPSDPSLLTSHVWHNDLHHENIFIDPHSLQILGIIDWQSVQITPLTDHCLDPSFLDYEGPDVGDNLERPEVPADMKFLQGEERTAALKYFTDKVLMIAWRILARDKNPAQHRAIRFQQSACGNILHLSRRIFEVGEAHFCALLLDLRDEWKNTGISHFPIEFSEEQVMTIEEDVKKAEVGATIIKMIQQRLGDLWPEKGLIEAENYNDTKSALREIKENLINEYKSYPGWDPVIFERLWPFDD
ncbi:hypothetical protein LOZ52_005611 [Ophidiomyces ophidiicola]|uniref:uncharacterized protein n=1 Tax=Ophidiomyces ophidiicola TaxID=1387563 RepID=UPI0020C47E7C|nr:uncharacterized protein LOZ57_000603 [Ophidiomyces ophidiicola]KAI1907927.1 hypothetical protein LOZ64_005705 [Ophidiomyces ophidiicola]KAI1954253.1 hypothetical protein LOZ57_000603 [Ophidiomyces ophidiicola]KAI2423003.1 hypothetical protein LOZ52_005611 [Ophidiomyces ophidiicola]KAI2438035.1 hypothetical protein LOZ08_005078 [Ophidiomyces ophidiicola]KAI2452733.1 Global transcription regulator sge1 [Ophidiomyces ophidiicola]